MTILENDVIPMRNKSLSRRKFKNSELKRKYLFEEDSVASKKQVFAEMLNGYRGDQRNNGEVLQDSPVATLSNMGNTCFLNSVLYTLRFAPTFLHNLHHLIGDLAVVSARLNQTKGKSSSLGRNSSLTGPSSRSTSSKDLLSLGISYDFIPKSKVQVVTEKLHELFMTMHSLELKESTDPYQPVALLQAIREANFIFEGNNQQDAHELLVYLLDNIRETCDVLTHQVQHNPDLLNEMDTLPTVNNSKLWNMKRPWGKISKKKDKNNKEAISEEQANGIMNTDHEDSGSTDSNQSVRRKLCYNFVAEDFEGITLRRTKCLECESVTERKEPFYDIPVPISIKEEELETTNANDIFRRACVTTEKLCDSNKYLCEKCDRYNEASREVLFEKLPNIMVLQLKRFTTSSSGVQKVNTYLPTPLELECFCEICCRIEDKESLPHHYQLCCVIMHLGGTMASGHYIAYVKASDHFEDYSDCTRDLPKGSLSASSSEKSLNLLKLLKPKALSIGNSLLESKNGLSSKALMNGVRMCKSMDCCGVKLNKNVVENVINSYSRKTGQDYWSSNSTAEDMWLECDDENIRPITRQEFIEELAYKPNSTSTPYLLFYNKISEIGVD